MKVTFDFANQQVGIEGDGPELVQVLSIVREIAPSLPSISIVTNRAAPQSGTQQSASNGFGQAVLGSVVPKTMRQFVRSLTLSNVYEHIAAIAYYQTQFNSRQTVSPKELGEWFTQCGKHKPAQMGVALSDCRRRYGYMENVGHGTWRLTTNGENLIIGKMEEGGAEEES